MATIFRDDFSTAEDVFNEFQVPASDREHIELLYARYTQEWYEGDAHVIYRDTRDGKLYEVHGSHCSCYGLEDQWGPEETTVVALRFQVENGRAYRGNEDDLRLLLAQLETPPVTGRTTNLDCEHLGHDFGLGSARYCIRCGVALTV